MIHLKRIALVWLVTVVGIFGMGLDSKFSMPGTERGTELGMFGVEFAIPGLSFFISDAEAVIGRPVTPLSYAGVARRTTRRTARRTAYRLNTLPAGCIYGPYYGGNYYKCGNDYYEQSGDTYTRIVFD